MALLFTKVRAPHRARGGPSIAYWQVTCDNNYPVGGWTINASDIQMQSIDALQITSGPASVLSGTLPVVFAIDNTPLSPPATSKKLQAFAPTNSSGVGGGEINGGATFLSGLQVMVVATGNS